MYYRRIEAVTMEFEGKGPGGMRRVNRRRPYSSRRDLLELSDTFPPVDPRSRSPYPVKQSYPPYNQTFAQRNSSHLPFENILI